MQQDNGRSQQGVSNVYQSSVAGHVLFVGAGSMGKSLLKQVALEQSNYASLSAADHHRENLDLLADCEIEGFLSLDEAYSNPSKEYDVIFLAIKPQVIPDFLKREGHRFAGKLVISMAAGLTCATLSDLLDSSVRVIRIMPNLAVSQGLGMIALCTGENATGDDEAFVKKLLRPCGIVEVIPEDKIDIFTVLAGSSPAFFAHIVEMFTREGVRHGLTAKLSRTCVVQSMQGTAALLAKTGEHPAELIDRVSSPGGTTIEGVRVLDKDGHKLIEEVVLKSYGRSQTLAAREEK